ncbi:DUF4145 domain-containing protein [Ancylomarina sp. YFZ004]
MKDSIWRDKYSLTEEGLVATCPNCQKSKLTFKKLGTQITEEGRFLDEQGYPYGIEHRFIGFLECLNKNCNHLVSIAGIVQKDICNSGEDEYGRPYEENFDNYVPQYYCPNIRYFNLTNQVPDDIRETIDLAFYHYFFDTNASANKIRIAIELILDNIGAPKTVWNAAKTKKITLNSLHQRIENFSKNNKNVGTLMLANKYIGNDGSHIGNVEDEELLAAFDNLEEIIDQIYIKKSEQLVLNAEKLIKKKKKSR